jgi:hypothetical protein
MKRINPSRLFGAALAGALFLVASTRAAGSEPWPELPVPPQARVEWVSDSMRVNGVPMRVMHFESRAQRQEVVEYYRSYWSGGYETRPSVRALGDATVVGQAHGPYFMTVKVKDSAGGGSEGLISVSRLLGTRIERSAGPLSLMPGAKVLQVVESNDPGKTDRQVLIANPSTPQSVAQYYVGWFQGEGWQLVQSNDVPRTAKLRDASVLVFQRGREEAQLSIVEAPSGKGSVLLANLLTKGTGPQAF